MLKNIYTPLAGALSQERALETIANNLANVNTAGYKGDRVTFKLYESDPYPNYPDPLPPANYKVDLSKLSPLVGNEMNYVNIAEISKDYSQGPALTTHNKFDLMIEGQGFFEVQTKQGTRYQRAGDLTLSQSGALVNKHGEPILGEQGVIHVHSQNFEVNRKGEVYQDGRLVDKIRLVNLGKPSEIEHVGGGKVFYRGPVDEVVPAEKATIAQGFLEGSNVNAMKNLTAMIVSHRSYEAYQKAVSNYDKIMEKSSNTIGNIRA